MTQDLRIDAYIERAAPFAQPILSELRDAVHAACPQVEESIRWSMPSFTYAGAILCQMAAFKQHASFGYWKHALVMGEGAERDGMGSYGKREYIEWITEAKREETRAKRLAQTIVWLAEGKRRNWKYENC